MYTGDKNSTCSGDEFQYTSVLSVKQIYIFLIHICSYVFIISMIVLHTYFGINTQVETNIVISECLKFKMKFLVFIFALFVCLVGFTNATICAKNIKTGAKVNFNSVEVMNKANREAGGEYLYFYHVLYNQF